MSKVSIIGSGQVGSTCADLLVQKGLANVLIVDIVEGLPQGKALDISQSASILGFPPRIIGTNDLSDMVDSDIVVITAGLARKPGMSRADLLKSNAQVVKSVVDNIVQHAPSAIILVVTNPVDIMAYFAYKTSGFDSSRVIGVSGVLDSARFNFFLSEELNISPGDIQCMVIGAHDDTMVPLVGYSKAKGKSISQLIAPDILGKIVERTKKGGAEIVSYLKNGSAFYAPGAAIANMVEAVLTDKKEILPASTYLSGQYGLDGLYIGIPCRIGREGIIDIAEIDLTEQEKEELKKSAEAVKNNLTLLGGLF